LRSGFASKVILRSETTKNLGAEEIVGILRYSSE
jgi:hypothetical protein